MVIDTSNAETLIPVALAVLHFLLGVFVRPRVSQETWSKLGPVADALDVTFGNYGTARNAGTDKP